MLSDLKKSKFFCPTIGLLCVIALIVAVSALRPILWTDGTGISVTLDKWLWGNTPNIQRNEAKISKTVEIDKKGNIVKTIEINKYDYGKTVWDWLSLLGVPLTLFFLGAWLQKGQQERADNEAKEEILQTYFDRLSVLLIDKNLIALANKSNSSKIALPNKSNSGEIKPEEQDLLDSAIKIIQGRTLSILRRFENDIERKNSVMRFLIESDIINKLNIDLSWSNISKTKLFRANFIKIDLMGANLSECNLIETDLSKACLIGSKLAEANLSGVKLILADLTFADLSGANLYCANLSEAKFYAADLSKANLTEANLSEANLSGANLSGANLSGADLKDIEWDSNTVWPDKISFDRTKNIPEDLKKKLDL